MNRTQLSTQTIPPKNENLEYSTYLSIQEREKKIKKRKNLAIYLINSRGRTRSAPSTRNHAKNQEEKGEACWEM